MCGIFGYWDRSRQALADAALSAMAAALVHRGPDDEGIRHQPARGVALGNRRLSIIDLQGGHQPFVSDDGLVTVVQNGEIFNYLELADELRAQGVALKTASDTEVILRLYEREGIACLRRLNGMFAIAIDDARQDALYLARDRIGVKPLYVADDGRRLLFGSEIKAILAAGPAVRARGAIDLVAVHHYLSFNYIPAPWTIWQGVRHVMPGTWMRFDRAAVRTQRWWDLSLQEEREQDFGAWSQEFLALLDDATRLRLRADVPWGAFLSGGVDSSTIVALMSRHVERPVRTFCIGFADPRYDESAPAQAAADRFGCDHTMEVAQLNMLDRWPQVLHHLDQPHGDASFLPTLRVSELAARHVKVVLTGDGGDELFAGYDKYAAFFSRPHVQALPEDAFQRSYFDSISLFSAERKLALYQPGLRSQLEGCDSFDVARPWFDQAQHFDRVNQALYLDMQLLLCGNNLVKPDRMGMAVSIEARTPFLDWRMMEFAFRSRGATKLSAAGDKKHWYRKAVEPLIGPALAHRKKQMFTVPVGEWFRGESFPWLQATLQGSDLLDDLFQAPAIETLLVEHRSGQADRTRELRALAALALWAGQALP
jgi:asparagine synthase (glutamine-hydrolysing)